MYTHTYNQYQIYMLSSWEAREAVEAPEFAARGRAHREDGHLGGMYIYIYIYI